LGIWGFGDFWAYPLLRVLPLAVSLLQRVPFSNAKKEPKGFAPAFGPSLELGVPSLRNRSGRSGYGLLRCTYVRCVRLRRTVATLPPPGSIPSLSLPKGQKINSRIKSQIKIKSQVKIKSPSP